MDPEQLHCRDDHGCGVEGKWPARAHGSREVRNRQQFVNLRRMMPHRVSPLIKIAT